MHVVERFLLIFLAETDVPNLRRDGCKREMQNISAKQKLTAVSSFLTMPDLNASRF